MIGRWQRGKDLGWYGKDTREDIDLKANRQEIKSVKEQEAEAMAEGLFIVELKILSI